MSPMTVPIEIWRRTMCFWIEVGRTNAELTLRAWQMVGKPPLVAMDHDIAALFRAAARPADVPDPVAPKPRTVPKAAPATRAPSPAAPAPPTVAAVASTEAATDRAPSARTETADAGTRKSAAPAAAAKTTPV